VKVSGRVQMSHNPVILLLEGVGEFV